MTEQHNTAPRRLRFGTEDWRRPDWDADYYPEDLPADWRLGYYANALSAVLLPAAAWRDEDAATLAAWAEEVHDDFRFYLMADPAQDPAAQSDLAAALGDRLGGLLWPATQAPAGLLAPLHDLPAGIGGWGDGGQLWLALLDVAGLDLRGQRGLLDALAPRLTEGDGTGVILTGAGVGPEQAQALQTVAELMGLA